MPLLPCLLLALSPIQIDGSFQDWEEGVTHQKDDHYLYQLIELPSEACLQQLPEEKVVELGQYTILFSPKDKGYGVSCKKGNRWISPYDAGVVFAPTTASTKFELRVNKPKIQIPSTLFDFKPKGDFRVVSWNVQFGNILDDKTRSSRILQALVPDIILFQEFDGEDSPGSLRTFLQKSLGGQWRIEMSAVHGTERHHQLRSAVAARHDASFFAEMGQFKALYGVVDFEEKPVNFFSLHLRCCGGPTSEAEEQRQDEARRIRKAIQKANAKRWVIAGDWNLVGTKKPLEIVQGEKLATVNAFQPDGLLTATWSDIDSSFTPGRLDWMLYTPETLTLVHSFVLDTADLDKETLQSRNLLAEDTAKLSDHLPLVADFNLIK